MGIIKSDLRLGRESPRQELGVLPPPLRGRVGEGGRSLLRRCRRIEGPPPLTPPQQKGVHARLRRAMGEGNRAERAARPNAPSPPWERVLQPSVLVELVPPAR